MLNFVFYLQASKESLKFLICKYMYCRWPFYKPIIKFFFFKPGARPQPAFGQLWGRLWARTWFTEIVLWKVCVYLSIYLLMFVHMHPRERNF